MPVLLLVEVVVFLLVILVELFIELVEVIGRFVGCGLFIVLSICLSDTFAIRYALLIIGIIQLVSIGISRNIIRALDRAEAE